MAKKSSKAKPQDATTPPTNATPTSPLTHASKQRPDGVKGIHDLVWVQAKYLKDAKNPLNWRKHSQRQREGVQASIQENGWAGGVVYNTVTKRMLDGHLRQDLDPEQYVPVFVGEFTESQERRILHTLDPLSAMAEMDLEAFRNLDNLIQADLNESNEILNNANKEIFNSVSLDLNDMAKGIASGQYEQSFLPPSPETAARISASSFNPNFSDNESTQFQNDDFTGVVDLKEYEALPSSNALGIPDLRSDMLSDTVPSATWAIGIPLPTSLQPTTNFIYGSNRIGGPNSPTECRGHVLSFFTDDARFEVTWNKLGDIAKRFFSQKWGGVCTPDFSTWWNWPLAHQIWNIYRQRYVGRYWQEAGIKIIPGLCCTGNIKNAELEVSGIPKNPPVVMFECRAGYSAEKDKGDNERRILLASINKQLQLIEPNNCVIYGGKEHIHWLRDNLITGPRYHFLEQWATVRQRASDTFTKDDNK